MLNKLEMLGKDGVSKIDLKLLEETCKSKNRINVVKILKEEARKQ